MSGSNLRTFDGENFEVQVLGSRGLVLVDFWSEGCVPCKQLNRVLTQLADEISPDVRIGTVNAGENESLVERFDIRGVPTLLFFKDGAVVEKRTGVDRRQVLKKLVDLHA